MFSSPLLQLRQGVRHVLDIGAGLHHRQRGWDALL